MGGAEKETKRIADLLEVKALTGSSASKSFVLTKLSEAESMYFATNVSWSHSHIVLSANNEELTDGSTEVSSKSLPRRFSGDGGSALYRRGVADGSSASSLPEPNEYQLSLSDLIDAKPKAKILVISGCHRPDSPRILAENLMIMSECLLASGIDAVLLPLWPCSFQGSRLMMNAFYSSLLYGSRASRALAYAMQIVASNSKHSHPSNWAGYMLLGKDIVLKDRALDLARALRSMIQAPQDYLIAALKTLQAMIVTSLKHLSQGVTQTEPKIAHRSTIEAKVGAVNGWEELLSCNGFHFISQIKKDVQATIVFPEHDDSGLQKKTHRAIEALLGLPSPCLSSLSTLSKHPIIARPLLSAVKSGITALSSSPRPDTAIEIQLEKEIWAVDGCSSFFETLRFSPSPPSTVSSCVVLQAPAKRLEAKMLQFASTAILSVFGPEEYMELPPQKLTVFESELL
jgi:hypothetical protein